MLKKENILNQKFKTKKVFVQAWNDDILITQLSVKEKNEIENIMFETKDITKFNNKFNLSISTFNKQKLLTIAFGVVNEDGSKMFTIKELENIPNSNAIDDIYNFIVEFNEPKK